MARLITLIPALGLVLSCSNRLEPVGSPSVRGVSFNASRELLTKTALKGNDVVWSDGDRVAVFSGSHKAEFGASEVKGSSCTLSGILPDGGTVYALYPFSEETSCKDGTVSSVLPSAQKAVKGGFDPASALAASTAEKAGDDMVFRNVGALLRFSLSAETASDLVEISLKSTSGAALSGKADIAFVDGVPTVTPSEGGSDEVVLSGHFEAGEYCFVVLPGTHDGLTMTFKKARSTGRLTSAFKGTFERSTVSEMGTVAPASWEDSDNYKPVTLDISFSNGSAFVNPFASPDLTLLPTNTTNPSYMGTRTGLTLPASDGGYVFSVFGSKGVARSANGLVFGALTGDYIEFPEIPGLCLNRVTLTAGGAFIGMNITSAEGESVIGGETVLSSSAIGEILEWTLFESERSCAYRLQTASDQFVTIKGLKLEYGLDPVAKPTGSVSPFDYGLREAATGQARFEALRRTHVAALNLGVSVDYTGVGTVELVIPSGAKPIPLTRETDFKGTVFRVHNDVGKFFLFSLENVFSKVSVSGSQIDEADYSAVPALASGLHILKVADDNHWVDDREGFDHPHDRADAFLVRDGVGSCGPVASYSTAATKINAEWCTADDSRKSLSNVTLERFAESTQNVCLASFRGQNNLYISNVTIRTPQGTGICGDTALDIRYCTNVLCEDMLFDGLYCEEHGSGYGLSINTTWNTTFRRITSHCLWAAFGCNNMQDSYLYDSDVERFDIHCYGKNITIRNSTLTGKGLPCSSLFGTVRCEDVKFVSCFLFAYRDDYNSYTPFDIVIRNCEMWVNGQNGLISMGQLDKGLNARPELSKKSWPNLDIDGLTVHLPAGMPSFSFYYINDMQRYPDPVGYISSVKVKNMTYLYSSSATFKLYVVTYPLKIDRQFNIELDNLDLAPEGYVGNIPLTVNVTGGTVSSKVTNSNVILN